MEDLCPLFSVPEDGDNKLVYPTISRDGKKGDPSKVIDAIAEQIKESVAEMLAYKKLGQMTFATLTALESIHKIGAGNVATGVLSSPAVLFQIALFCSIGIEIGRHLPKEVELGTILSESGTSLWSIPDGVTPTDS